MSDNATILTDITDNIMTLTLNRPDKLNAYNWDMMQALITTLDTADADDQVRAVIVTGAGRAFCAGADLSGGASTFDYEKSGLQVLEGSPVRADGTTDYSHPSVRDGGGLLNLRIFNLKKPIIAAINGPAFGIGATMCLPMDVRLISDQGRFGFPFTRIGIAPDGLASWFLPRIVGVSRAVEWCMGAANVSADEALESGLVRAVHAPDELLPAARIVAERLTRATAPVSVALTRQMIWRMAGAAHPMEAHQLESRAIWDRGRAQDAAEGVSAFLQKRPAEFPGRVSTDLPHYGPWMDDPDYT